MYKNLKRLLCLAFAAVMVFTATACTKEYKIVDEKLHGQKVTDNYRTYYQIFMGSFSDSNDDGIGDIRGVINRFDYLNDGDPNSGTSLGIEGIWFTPIMPSPSYHKYDVRDYKAIDPKFGTMEDFEELLALAEERGVKIIIDLVLNHTSHLNPWFLAARQAIKDGDFDNQYLNYYTYGTQPKGGWHKLEVAPDGTQYYYEGHFSDQMPELDMDNPKVLEEVEDIVKFWLDKGVGGFRLDAVKYIYYESHTKNIEFLKWFRQICEDIDPECYIVAENWSEEQSILAYYSAVNCFDFSFSEGRIPWLMQHVNSVTHYTTRLEAYQKNVLAANENAILNPFLSNHDQDRVATMYRISNGSAFVASNIYILSSGSPFIYYGEEIGMFGKRGSEQTDANRRLAMLWGDGDTVKDPIGTTFDSSLQVNGTVKSQLRKKDSLVNHYKKLIMLRRANPEIARGTIKAINFDSFESFGGFLSTYNGSTVGVFHNILEEPLTIDLSLFTDHNFSDLRGYVGMGDAKLDGTVLTISGQTSVVLR